MKTTVQSALAAPIVVEKSKELHRTSQHIQQCIAQQCDNVATIPALNLNQTPAPDQILNKLFPHPAHLCKYRSDHRFVARHHRMGNHSSGIAKAACRVSVTQVSMNEL